MRRHFALVVAMLVAILPCAAQSASADSLATIGVGAHGWDLLVGTWSCKNSLPSALSGPATITIAIARSVGGSLSIHASGANYDGLGYVVYDAKTKTWWAPAAGSNGGYGTESTQQSGKKTIWAGTFVDPTSGKVTQRDTFTFSTPTSYTDLYQIETGGVWKTQGNSTCTKQ